jgi:hypothetical protein
MTALHTFLVLEDVNGQYIPFKGGYVGQMTDTQAMVCKATSRAPGYVRTAPVSSLWPQARALVAAVEYEDGREPATAVRVWVTHC